MKDHDRQGQKEGNFFLQEEGEHLFLLLHLHITFPHLCFWITMLPRFRPNIAKKKLSRPEHHISSTPDRDNMTSLAKTSCKRDEKNYFTIHSSFVVASISHPLQWLCFPGRLFLKYFPVSKHLSWCQGQWIPGEDFSLSLSMEVETIFLRQSNQ